mgnify:CR=1 FL=1
MLTRNSIRAGSLKLLKDFERDPESRETIEAQIMSQHETIGPWIMEKQLGVSRDQWGFWIVREINSPEGKQYVMKMAYHDARDDASSQKQGENLKDEALSYLFIREVILAKKPYLGLNSCPPRNMYYEETVGDDVTLRFLIMDYVEGTSWARVKSTLSIQENVAIAINVLDCLQALHAERHVFRDLHPDNVMLYKDAGKEDGQYRIKLIDYESLTRPEIMVTADVAYVANYVSLHVLQTGQFTPYDDIETVLYMLDECLRGLRPEYPKIRFTDTRQKGETQAAFLKKWNDHDDAQNRLLRSKFEEFYADSPLIELMRKLWSIERPPFKRDKKTWSEIPTLTLHEEVRSKMVMLMLSRMNLNLGSSCTIS